MIELERRNKALIGSAVLVLAILSGIAVMAYANAGTGDTNTQVAIVNGIPDDANFSAGFGWGLGGHPRGGMGEFFGGQRGGCGLGGSVTVSQEFRDNVINITGSDTDVQKLLAEGYNVTEVRPLINATIATDGTVTMKATNAIVTLVQNTTGRALVWVNVEQAKVTRIVILTMTVIEKP